MKLQRGKGTIEKSRKRRRFQIVKKHFFAGVIIGFIVVGIFFSWYFLIFRNKPLYVSPLPMLQTLQKMMGSTNQDPRADIAQALEKNNIAYEDIDTRTTTAYSIKLKDGQEVLLSTKKDITSQIASLQVILNRLTMEGRKFSRLDLRFTKPAIVFK